MLRKGLSAELRWFFVYLCAVTFVGFSFGYPYAGLTLALASYLAWTFYRLRALEVWVLELRRGSLKDNHFNGIWSEIAEDVKLLQQRFEKDRLRLQAVVSRVQEMTSALSDGVILLDKRANIEWWNQAAANMFGFKDVDLGSRVSNIIRDPRFQNYFDEGKYDEPLDIESTRREDQFYQYQIHPFGNGEHLVVVRDITRVSKLEQMRQDFVANVSHELRTPLTVIRGYVETLLDQPGQKPVFEKALQQMQLQGQRMTLLINDLIVLTKLETDDRNIRHENVALHDLTQTIFNDALALSSEKHVYLNEVDKKLIVLGNEKELRSALSNLILNAVKYSPDGCEIRVSSELQSDHLVIHVTDNGIGIDPKHIPRLTERFYRVDSGRASSMGGTGLGLAIVKHVLLRHDGYITIRSKLRKGSTFSCHIPLERVRS